MLDFPCTHIPIFKWKIKMCSHDSIIWNIGFLENFLRQYFWRLKFVARLSKNQSCCTLEVYALTLRVIVKCEVMMIMILHGLFSNKSPLQASFSSWLVSRSFRKKWGGTVFCAFLEGFLSTPGLRKGCRSLQNSHHPPSLCGSLCLS